LKIYLLILENTSRREEQRERERISSRLLVECEAQHGARSQGPEIMT